MGRVIQDSDDESLGPVSPVRETEERPEDAKGTSLTGRLVQDMHAAANGLIGIGMDATSGHPNDTIRDFSSPLTSGKRRKTISTLNGPQNEPSRDMSSPLNSNKRGKTIRTYSSSNKRMRLSEQDEAERFEALRGNTLKPEAHLEPTWDLPATLYTNFAQHEPTAMFSEPSSTVPDNTASQQRIIQEALAADNHNISPGKSDPTQRSESSIPWSAYMATQPQSPNSQTARNENAMMLPPDQLSSTSNRRSKTLSAQSRSSQTYRRSSPAQDVFCENQDSPSLSNTSKSQRRTKPVDPTSSSSKKSRQPTQRISDIEVPLEEDAQPVQKPTEKPAESRKAVTSEGEKRGKALAQPMESSSDDWVGLPKEQYRPKPSRSRSAYVIETSEVDSWHTPEPTSRAKRRKTSHDTPTMSEGESLIAIVNMGFTPERAQLALRDVDGSIERAIGILAASPARGKENVYESESRGTDFPINDTTAPKKRGEKAAPMTDSRPPKSTLVSVEIPPGSPMKSTRPIIIVAKGQPELKVKEIDSISPPLTKMPASTRNGKPNRRHTTAGVPARSERKRIIDSDEESAVELSPMSADLDEVDELAFDPEPNPKTAARQQEAPQEKKRGRGRPRKSVAQAPTTTSPEEPIEKIAELVEDRTTDDSGEGGATHGMPQTPGQGQQKISSTENIMKKKTILPPSTPAKVTTERRVVTPSTPEEQTTTVKLNTLQKEAIAKSPLNHSPINKSKVPLRVGLSKRTRIAPLLKIVRK